MPDHRQVGRAFRGLVALIETIILAGGRGQRMGGVDKASVLLNGRRLIDHLLAAVPGPIIVVSPHDLPLPAGVRRVSEDPPFGGPVAGIAAAAALTSAELVAVLSVDAPDSPALIPLLIDALHTSPTADVAVARADDGWVQPLCAVWRRHALLSALDALPRQRDIAAKKLLAQAAAVEVPGVGLDTDYDTLAELATRGELS
ncbi:MAG: molybdenum cofactor guanylyltransferase [Corynebacterium sp.]|uniref:molybdenum cofactor guanylyltransferase n=1 Tax=Corynebacterium sp. TaxID=1720 RepID=UPI0026E004BE|nr:molybdenum cofactor guanylyltransferase [Corynebacterium sp.]MDO5670467.1 molybdenum cofactor guanylyltransferase [Corynebacterium sp.]